MLKTIDFSTPVTVYHYFTSLILANSNRCTLRGMLFWIFD